MKKRHYLGVIEHADEGFGIYFPDFPGCISGGDTIEDVIAMGREALQFHVDGMVEDAETIPEPAPVDLEAERAEVPDAKLHSLAAIEVALPVFPDTVEVGIDTSLLKEIDQVTGNRRQFIVEAARRELERLQKPA